MGILFFLWVLIPLLATVALPLCGRRFIPLVVAIASVVSIAGAVGALVWSAFASNPVQGAHPSQSYPLLEGYGHLFGIYLDRLSGVMLFVVSVIGAVTLRYSVRYFDGDPRQVQFLIRLGRTVAAVQLLVLSSSLVMFLLAWVAVSLSLHQLLMFYPDRPAAVACARKKFLISRLGDVALVAAIVLIYQTFGTVDFSTLFITMKDDVRSISGNNTHLIALLLSLVALTKSAQLPFHSWLPDSLEAPTPVSALMHAGIINGGGFLLIRLSLFFENAPIASALLAIVGALTAVFGMSVMVTQSSIKKRLAYSTVGQMGFMVMQCGLGLYYLALLHITAHAFYKAYAFLRAGSAMDQAHQQLFFPLRTDLSTYSGWVHSLVITIAAIVVWLGATNPALVPAPYLPILIVWILACLHLLLGAAMSQEGKFDAVSAALFMIGVMTALYLALSNLFFSFFGDLSNKAIGIAVTAPLGALFCASFCLHLSMPVIGRSGWGRCFFVHLHNGFYCGVLFDRLTQALVGPVRGAVSAVRRG